MLTEEQGKKYFVVDEKDGCVRFMGDKLECFIPTRYAAAEYLTLAEQVHALGIFPMRIDDKIDCGLQLPAIITIDAVQVESRTVDDVECTVALLHKGGRLMTTLDVMQVDRIGYFMWREFLSQGNIPKFLDYNGVATLFDDLSEIAGRGASGNHAVLEIVYAHLFRDAKDPRIRYRNTDMKTPPVIVNLRDVGYGPATTHSRMIGSYSETGLNSALINPSSENHELEDLFRA